MRRLRSVLAFLPWMLFAFGCGGRAYSRSASVIGDLRTINTAEITYASTYPHIGFSQELLHLGTDQIPCTAERYHSCLIDQPLALGERNGYRYLYTPGIKDGEGVTTSYEVLAKPLHGAGTSFFTDQSGVIRSDDTRDADRYSEPIQ